jgi:glycerol-3-phosphate dehydrogenase
LQGKLLMSAAFKLNDLISFDRNRNLKDGNKISAGRVISKHECLSLCPVLNQSMMTGGGLFFDAQVQNPSRLNLAVLLSAVQSGAVAANYVSANQFLREGNNIVGVCARDVLGGDSFSIRARLVVNCAGPWAGQVLEDLGASVKPLLTSLCKAFVLVTRRLAAEIAVGVPSRFEYRDSDAVIKKGYRYFFITPWRNTSLVGTFQSPYRGTPESVTVTEFEIQSAIDEINAALPGAELTRADVTSILKGLVPASGSSSQGEVQLKKQHEIYDHATVDGINGLVSVLGVKYTTARSVAEKTVNLVCKKLGRETPRSETAEKPVHGGEISSLDEFLTSVLDTKPSHIAADTMYHLVQTYGSNYGDILRYCDIDSRWSQGISAESSSITAQVVHGVRAEMAQKLADVVFRRTDLGTAGYPGHEAISTCAEIMAPELGWDRRRVSQELSEVDSHFGRN